MRIVHYYRDLSRPSGVTRAIASWQSAAEDLGLETIALHAGPDGGWSRTGQAIRHIGKGRHGALPLLAEHLTHGDVLFVHEGWMTSNYVAARTARRQGIPVVVVPHGVYEPGVMRGLKGASVRKFLLERHYLSSAYAVQVFYGGEVGLVHKIAPAARAVIAPTPFETSVTSRWVDPGPTYVGWFGRFDPDHKGLDRLIAAHALARPGERLPLRLCGPDYNGGRAKVIRLIEALALEDVSVESPVSGERKEDFLNGARAFVFPSRWESQGISLLEAMAKGVPTLVSDSIQMAPELRRSGAARLVDFDQHLETAKALEEVRAGLSLDAISERGQSYVSRELSNRKSMADLLTRLRDVR